jgi:sigma-E factor negative regulatory protein RseB
MSRSGWLLLLLPLPLFAAALGDDWRLLQRVTDAGMNQSLTGTFMHQVHGDGIVETFRIVRVAVPGSVLERRVAQDGPPREIVRNGETLTCYAPDPHALQAAKISAMRMFPALMSDDIADVSQSYSLRQLGRDRVANKDCNWLELQAHDHQRYTERICAEIATGLPLKMVTLTPQNALVEQYAFTEIDLNGPHDRNQYKSAYKISSQVRGPQPKQEAEEIANTRIVVSGLPSGFHLLRSVERSLLPDGGDKQVRQLVFSDGLVMLSLFVEAHADGAAEDVRTLNRHGAINLATRSQGGQRLTLVGDMPESTLSSLIRTIHIAVRP